MPQYFGTLKPVNQILCGGQPDVELLSFEIGANATAAQMVPGRFVVFDTTDGDVKEAGAKAHDVAGILEVTSGMKVTDAYAVGDECLVIPLSSGARVLATLVSGSGAVAPGSKVVTAANGKAALQAVGGAGTQGDVVGKAEATEDPSAADKTCIVTLIDGAELMAAT